jgi:hypothetical protein
MSCCRAGSTETGTVWFTAARTFPVFDSELLQPTKRTQTRSSNPGKSSVRDARELRRLPMMTLLICRGTIRSRPMILAATVSIIGFRQTFKPLLLLRCFILMATEHEHYCPYLTRRTEQTVSCLQNFTSAMTISPLQKQWAMRFKGLVESKNYLQY